jgi:class 3 adenylate cyclase
VTEIPETRYARSPDGTSLGYQVSGAALLYLVFVGGAPRLNDLMWDDPDFLRFAGRLGTFTHTVWFDHRGIGASQGDSRDALDPEMFDVDLTAVLDAVSCEQVALLAWSFQGPSAIHFTVTHPERVKALVLANACAYYLREAGYPWGVPPEHLDRFTAAHEDAGVSSGGLEVFAPSRSADERFQAWWGRAMRLATGPGQIGLMARAGCERDVRPILSSISVPTLVLHREEDRYIRIGAGRYLAEHIPGAKFVVLPGADHLLFVGDTDAVVDEIEEFLTGTRSGGMADVVTMTILFTDIVASTEHQSRLGQREWSRLTDHHDAIVRAALVRHRGHEVRTTGDGFLTTFDATGRALRCAAEIVAGAKGIGLELRAGVHTGEIEVRGDDIAGLAVNIAKRVCDMAAPREVLVSETVRSHMVGSGIVFKDRGEHELKGVPGTWRLFAIGA